MFYPQGIIRKKRDRLTLSRDEIHEFCQGIAKGTVSEGQIAAFAMAVFLNGMSLDERVALTLAMRDSGSVLDWSTQNLNGPVLDKHSTGGVGDGVSLVLGPMLAACGAHVPMISGRGLGHTGGTLDKLEAIPGYNTIPDKALFQKTVRDVGVAIIGQTADLAPADARLYATRDVTATVESIDLITASILSKKLAAGLDGLVMDVKVGNGAFMPTYQLSRELAATIVAVAHGAGLRASALLTDMNQCLSSTAGNAIEIRDAIAYLTGESRNPRFHAVVMGLGEQLLLLGKLAEDSNIAQAKLQETLSKGRAAESFAKMVRNLGGPHDLIDRPDHHLPQASVIRAVPAPAVGYVNEMDTRALGMSVVALGGGRRVASDKIDHSVGLSEIVPTGARVSTTTPLAMIHARSESDWETAANHVQASFSIGEEPPKRLPDIIREKLISP